MLKAVSGIAFCVLLAGCGGMGTGGGSDAQAGSKAMPPECESYFKRLAQCKGPGEANTPEAAAAEMDGYRKAWNPDDPQQMSVAQCRQMDATLAAGGDSC